MYSKGPRQMAIHFLSSSSHLLLLPPISSWNYYREQSENKKFPDSCSANVTQLSSCHPHVVFWSRPVAPRWADSESYLHLG